MVGYNDRLASVTNAAKRNDSSKPVKMQMSKKKDYENKKNQHNTDNCISVVFRAINYTVNFLLTFL